MEAQIIEVQAEERSLLTLLPDGMAEAVERLDPNDLVKTEEELEKQLAPTAFACRIRIGFWEEYERVQTKNIKKMNMANVYRNVCHKAAFHQNIVKHHRNLLWVVTPPTEFMTSKKDNLYLGTKVIRRIFQDLLDMPVLDMEAARVGLKAFEITRNIVMGTLVQRIDSRTLSVTATAKDLEGLSLEELKQHTAKIKEVEKIDV